VSRRILFMLLAFTAVVLAGVAVPLTLSTIGQDRNSFIQDTQAMANADASVAQPRFVMRPPKPAEARPVGWDLLRVYKQVEQAGDGLVIYLSNGRVLDAKGQVPAGQWRQLAAQVGHTGQAFTGTMGSRAIAAVPVFNPGTLAGSTTDTYLLDNGVSPSSVTTVSLSGLSEIAALTSGSVDAGYLVGTAIAAAIG